MDPQPSTSSSCPPAPGPSSAPQSIPSTSKSETKKGLPPPPEELLLEEWNPMMEDMQSVQNLIGIDFDSNPGAFVSGVKEKKKRWNEIPCPWYHGVGKHCWKGPHCEMRHEVVDPNDWGTTSTHCLLGLEDKTFIPEEAWLRVIVIHIVSPQEFYIIPETSPDCACSELAVATKKMDIKKGEEEGKETETEEKVEEVDEEILYADIYTIQSHLMRKEFGTGYNAFRTMVKQLTAILQTDMAYKRRQSAYYEVMEVVAVRIVEKLEVEERQLQCVIWMRAVVAEMVTYGDESGRDLPWYSVQLLDTGAKRIVRSDDMCTLPDQFVAYPAMAYHCCLNDVMPVGLEWNKKIKSNFEETLLQGDWSCLMRVACSKYMKEKCHGRGLGIESVPYLVDLLVDVDRLPEGWRNPVFKTQVVQLSEAMAEAGEAIRLTMLPFRPRVAEFAEQLDPRSGISFLTGPLQAPTPLSEEVMQQETTRTLTMILENGQLIQKLRLKPNDFQQVQQDEEEEQESETRSEGDNAVADSEDNLN